MKTLDVLDVIAKVATLAILAFGISGFVLAYQNSARLGDEAKACGAHIEVAKKSERPNEWVYVCKDGRRF